MAFREVHVIQIREVLRLWLSKRGIREIARIGPAERKTVRRYVSAASSLGLAPGQSPDVLTDEILGQIVNLVRPRGPGVHGAAWCCCETHREFLRARVEEGLRLTKILKLFHRHTGTEVPYRTFHRFASQELGFGAKKTTVLVADCAPGEELQVDCGRLGIVEWGGRGRMLQALIFTSVYSRHMFVWPTLHQTLEAIVEGFEAAWRFFGGVFPVIIPDNCAAMVARADPLNCRLSVGFLEYCQHRDFHADAARARHPQDKPRVERAVPYVREDFFQGECFLSLEHVRREAERWCLQDAGMRTHGTTRKHPLEVFEQEEKGLLKAMPEHRYDVPLWVDTSVRRDQHAQVDYALYSLPIEFVGESVLARADSKLVRFFHNSRVVKTHPRKARGERSTDAQDYPAEVREYAMRDTQTLLAKALSHGKSVGLYADRLVAGPRPWAQMRHCYRLLGLVRTYGAERVDQACHKALELDVVDVSRIERMLKRALENDPLAPRPAPASPSGALRFLRSSDDFSIGPKNHQTKGDNNDE